MAITKRKRRGSWAIFGVRALGVSGLFASLLGAIGVRLTPGGGLRSLLTDLRDRPESLWQTMTQGTDQFRVVCMWLLVGGIMAAGLAGLILMIGGLGRIAGQRNAAQTNAALQTALVLALLIGVNVWSFDHYRRFDWTGRKLAWDWPYPRLAPSERFEPQFTLPESVIADLKQLRGETRVVVYQRHKTPGQLTDKPDAFDYAAERKIVEKVRDLVGLFREFGPTFRVEALDVEDESFTRQMKEIEKNYPMLAKAIDGAAVNSIFFHTVRAVPGSDKLRESVQRLSFNDFYQLDKAASKSAEDGRGNLVLLPQGIQSFARRVLAIEEKSPKVAIGTIHEYLTTEGQEELSMAGVRKTLEQHGFDVVDLVLKKGWNEGEPAPAAVTLNETMVERLEEELAEYDAVLAVNRQEVKFITNLLEKLKSNLTLDELNRELRPLLRGQRMDEASRKRNIVNLEPQLELLKDYMTLQERERNETLRQLEAVPGQERLAEQRRQTDANAKLRKLLSDVDLLILPRMTLRNAIVGDRIPARLYRLDEGQTQVVKEFMAAGKPVLGLFGPINEPATERRGPAPTGPDSIEALLAQLGVVFGNQTVLFNSEAKAFSQRRVSLLATGTEVEVPPVWFNRPTERGRASLEGDDAASDKPINPIARSLKIVAAAAGSADRLESLKLRHPRPVYHQPIRGDASSAAEFLFADAESWNESDPFPTREKTPRYEPTKPESPLAGTRDAEVRGPFPIGVAIETTVPADWRSDTRALASSAGLITAGAALGPAAVAEQALIPADTYSKEAGTRLRVGAIGHGGLFVGQELPPAKELLLLHTCNWLLARDERLPHDDRPVWKYPRVRLGETQRRVWRDAALIVMPASVAFLGALVLLVRKYR